MLISEQRSRWYLDSSVGLRIVLGHSSRAASWFDARVAAGDEFVSSRLLELEMMRVFRREQLDTADVSEFIDGVLLLRIDDALSSEAAMIRPHIKSLDALHLASARRVGTSVVTVVSHDANMLSVAERLGFQVFDPV